MIYFSPLQTLLNIFEILSVFRVRNNVRVSGLDIRVSGLDIRVTVMIIRSIPSFPPIA